MSWFKKDKPAPEAPMQAPAAPVEEPAADQLDASEEATPEPEERRVPTELADLFLTLEEHLTEIELEDVRAIVAMIPQPPRSSPA